MTVVFRLINYVELTPDGLGIHWFRMQRVPWPRIGSVDRDGSLGSDELKIFELSLSISRRLPAPRGAYGVGKKETAEARDLVVPLVLLHDPPHQILVDAVEAGTRVSLHLWILAAGSVSPEGASGVAA